jgi:sulfatase modifying factor 1
VACALRCLNGERFALGPIVVKEMRASRAVSCLGAAAVCVALLRCELVIDASHLDTGSGTDGGLDAKVDAPFGDAPGEGAVPLDAACPGEAGPSMVRVGAYCIDRTEVTNRDYQMFLGSDAGPSPPQCAWKQNYDHDGGWAPPNLGPTAPAGNVDWCDAYVYCRWAGKRLCGNPSGGSVPYNSYSDPASDEWYAACAGPDASTYPYGNTFNETTCNGLLADGGYPDGAGSYTVEPVANRASCQGAYPGIFDLSGNVSEWEDCCDDQVTDAAVADQLCRNRGGSAHSDVQHLRCDAPEGLGNAYARQSYTDDLGFRCCSP